MKTGWGPWPVVTELEAKLFCDAQLVREYLAARGDLFKAIRDRQPHEDQATAFFGVYMRILRRVAS